MSAWMMGGIQWQVNGDENDDEKSCIEQMKAQDMGMTWEQN